MPARPACARSRSTPTASRRALRVPRVPAALPAAGMGRARPRRHLARGRTRRSTEVVAALDGETVAGIGITNQRETVVVWDRRDGSAPPPGDRVAGPSHRVALRRPARRRRRAADTGAHRPRARPLLLGHQARVAAARGRRRRRRRPRVRHRRLMGAVEPRPACTRPSRRTPAARCSSTSTPLDWSDELLELFGVPRSCLPDGATEQRALRDHRSRPRRRARACRCRGIAGDQQAALFGQACFSPGMTKNTYGTGSFVLVNLGDSHPPPVDGLLTTVAWQLGDAVDLRAWRGRSSSPAPRCSGCATGSASSTRRRRPDRSPRACPTPTASCSCPRSRGSARRTSTRTRAARSFGLTRGTTRAHLVRAVVEAMAWQTADVIDAITAAAGIPLTELRVDGGASAMDVLCQFQADVLGVTGAAAGGHRDHRARRRLPRRDRRRGVGVTGRSGVGVAGGRRVPPRPAPPRPRTAGRLASWRRPRPQLGRSRRLMDAPLTACGEERARLATAAPVVSGPPAPSRHGRPPPAGRSGGRISRAW